MIYIYLRINNYTKMVDIKSISILELKQLMAIKYNRIRDILKERGTSQKWLADKTGVSPNLMSQICMNKHQPNIERLFEIAKILNVHPCELLGDGKDTGER